MWGRAAPRADFGGRQEAMSETGVYSRQGPGKALHGGRQEGQHSHRSVSERRGEEIKSRDSLRVFTGP